MQTTEQATLMLARLKTAATSTPEPSRSPLRNESTGICAASISYRRDLADRGDEGLSRVQSLFERTVQS